MKEVIHNAQVLRFIAAFMVLFGHVQHEATEAGFLSAVHFEPWTPVYFAGGVDIFFVISGFIMAHLSFQEFGKAGASWDFMRRRLVRVVPLYWVFTSAMLVALMLFSSHVTHSKIVWSNVLASYFFVPWENAYGRAYPVLILGWTLNFEMFFYTVMALSLTLSRSRGILFLYGLIALCGIVGWMDLPLPQPLAFWSNPIVFEFLFGVMLAQCRARGVRLPAGVALAMVAAAVVAMVVLQSMGIASHHWWARPFWMGVPALLICGAAVLSPEPAQPGAIKRLFSKGGDLSYSLYLSHPFSLTLVAMIWGRLHWTNPWVYIWVAVGASLLAAAAVHYWIERPLTERVRILVDRLRHQPSIESGNRHA